MKNDKEKFPFYSRMELKHSMDIRGLFHTIFCSMTLGEILVRRSIGDVKRKN
jgi:hypothetical protein